MNPSNVQVFDFSGMGMGNDCEVDDDNTSILGEEIAEEIATTDAVKNPDGSLNVTDLSLSFFREKLITHFNIMFNENKLQWPKSTKEDQDPIISL